MIWRQREPTLKEILSDSIVTALMAADGVDPHELEAMLQKIGRTSKSLHRARRWGAWSCRPASNPTAAVAPEARMLAPERTPQNLAAERSTPDDVAKAGCTTAR